MTELQMQVMTNLAINEMNGLNWGVPQSDDDYEHIKSGTWFNCLDLGPAKIPTGKQLSGVVSTLVQAGWVWSEGNTFDDAIGLTAEGLKVWLAKFDKSKIERSDLFDVAHW